MPNTDRSDIFSAAEPLSGPECANATKRVDEPAAVVFQPPPSAEPAAAAGATRPVRAPRRPATTDPSSSVDSPDPASGVGSTHFTSTSFGPG
jgi:hypothetical protein